MRVPATAVAIAAAKLSDCDRDWPIKVSAAFYGNARSKAPKEQRELDYRLSRDLPVSRLFFNFNDIVPEH